MVQVTSTQLLDAGPCAQTVRALRGPDGVACPSWEAPPGITGGVADTASARQRCAGHDGAQRLAALTDPLVAGHPQPLTGGVWGRYGRGRHGANEPRGQAWALHGSAGQPRTAPRRVGSVQTSPWCRSPRRARAMTPRAGRARQDSQRGARPRSAQDVDAAAQAQRGVARWRRQGRPSLG